MEFIFQYNYHKTGAICQGMTDKDFSGDVVIPATYDGLPVVEIAHEAFREMKMSSVHIPATVKSIGSTAFAYCRNLKRVTFDANSELENIGYLAFSGCRELTHIRLPERLHVIEYLAFNHCVSCTCEFPDRAVVMTPCFWDCKKVIVYEPDLLPLAPIEEDESGNKFRLNQTKDGYIVVKMKAKDVDIIVPKSFHGLPVVELGDKAFGGNDEAWHATIPESVKKSGYLPFYGCDELGSVLYGGTMEEWKNMEVSTWFIVICRDGIIEDQG